MTKTILLAQIAPQRSTQYSTLAGDLAPSELRLSPVGSLITTLDPVNLGGQAYLKLELTAKPDEAQLCELGLLAMTSAFFDYYERLGRADGPFLRPIDIPFQPALPFDLVMTRRYRGKTNEMFTHFLCNLARFSSDFAHRPWSDLRVFDPLAGGGTTLLLALVLGAEVMGVEKNAQDVQTTAAFIRDYMRTEGIACQMKEERLKRLGQRWWFSIGKTKPQQCVIAIGETAQSAELLAGVKKPHLIVTDLPYGIQHHGQIVDLLSQALPVWAKMLTTGGVLVMAWESARFPRQTMLELVESAGRLAILNDPPYDALAHRVDRVIKQRDVLVARRV